MTVATRFVHEGRQRVIRVFVTQGLAGLTLMLWLTLQRRDQTTAILERLGPNASILIAIFVFFATALGLLKFELTSRIFVSLGMMAFVAMPPLFGVVISSWLAVLVAIATRLLAMLHVGPVKIDMEDPVPEYAKTFGLFGTYGIPVVAAATLYEYTGGELPVTDPTLEAATRIALCGVVLILTNLLVMFRPARSYGYSLRKILRLDLIDGSIYLLTLPFVVVLTLAYGALGWSAVLALAFSGVVANFVARNLAITRSKSQQQLQRLASLTNIGKTISLRFTTDQLLLAIYTECKKNVDCTLFAIALVDESTNELIFELDVQDGAILPKERIPIGEGLNSWVVAHHEPLLVGSVADEKRIGIQSVADSKPTESWLGVPMMARDRVVGVISVESYRRNAFTDDDLILLTAIANQAAVAIDNAWLFRDLEGLTHALEQRVMERTNELREMNLRLTAADRSKNQFLANMSHELRTPLNSIIGFSGVLQERLRGTLEPRLYKFLENIQTAGKHLLDLISDILDLSKIEAGKMELRTDEFDLRDTIAAVERVMKEFAAQANVDIVCSIDSDVPRVRLDEGRLKQILFNLLSNAVKFSPAGGPVEIRARFIPRESSPISVDSVRIDVADSGIGIPEGELERIFMEFYQTEQGRRPHRGGTGLGLSLTRNFVELHHGKIDVESAVGKGSCFTMHLPVDCDVAAGADSRIGPIMTAR
jgi:signal transduction histidine kinase